MKSAMATRKGINISGNYAAPHKLYQICLFHIYICTLCFKKLKGRTKSYFILFLKLNDHPTRCLSRIHPNGCMFELKVKQNQI